MARIWLGAALLVAGCDDPAGPGTADAPRLDAARADARPGVDAGLDASPDATPPSVCAPTSITGTFEGAPYEPIARAAVYRVPANPDVVILRESPGLACDGAPQLERFIQIAFACSPIAVATYPVRGFSTLCPAEGPAVMILAQEDGGFLHGSAVSGEVVIESIDAGCITGTFSATFDTGDVLTAAFGAIDCS